MFSAKELTLQPGAKCTLKDPGASGWITTQGQGRMGALDLQTPTMIRFGQLTHDEYFVTESTAQAGVTITNPSPTDPIVMLKIFGPENPDWVKSFA